MIDLFTAGVAVMSAIENDQEGKVNDLVRDYEHCSVPASVITREMHDRGICYSRLPQYLKDRIDNIEVF